MNVLQRAGWALPKAIFEYTLIFQNKKYIYTPKDFGYLKSRL
jgi:hypothetical protein